MMPFHNILKIWFQEYKRDLPWRQNKDPYFVWISEIILQQTRVEQGLPYYYRFLERFPDIKSLARASEAEVLLVWQGLGYYSRARNLHYAARQILADYQGLFPGSYEDIQKLKGIGKYTAAAIASISFGLPYAVTDGNVYRVLSRIFAVKTPIDSTAGKKEFATLAQSLLDNDDPGSFNEAMMDFGALQCKPQNPLCPRCPFENICEARKNNQVDQLPVKSKRILQRNRYFYYLLIRFQNTVYLHKRVERDIWKNLYQFPLIETKQKMDLRDILLSNDFNNFFERVTPVIESVSSEIIHNLSHQKLYLRFISIRLEEPLQTQEYLSVPLDKTSAFPLPKPVNNFLKKEMEKGV